MDQIDEEHIKSYEDAYSKLKKCFNVYYGYTVDKRGIIPMREFLNLLSRGSKSDSEHHLPENALLKELRDERPVKDKVYGILKDTYLSEKRNTKDLKGSVGCIENPESQANGITNLTLLMYLSNQLAKQYERNEKINPERKEVFKKNKKTLYKWKEQALINLVSSIYVLEKTSDSYEDYFCYGFRQDNNDDPSFVIDLPHVGQICVHVGSEEQKKEIVEEIEEKIKSILEEKLSLNQVTEKQFVDLQKNLKKNSFLSEYDGKLYEYMAMPMDYKGKLAKEFEKIILRKIGKSSMREAKEEDVKTIKSQIVGHGGLNEREAYYLLIKIGAPRCILVGLVNEIQKEKEEEENARKKRSKEEILIIKEKREQIKKEAEDKKTSTGEEITIKPKDKKTNNKKENKQKDFTSENKKFLEAINANIGGIMTPEIMEGLLKRASYSFKDVYEDKLRRGILKELKKLGVSKEERNIESQKVFIYIRMVKNLSTVSAGTTNGKNLIELIENSVDEYEEGFEFLENHFKKDKKGK